MATIPPSGFAIHHTAGSRCSTQEACDQEMRRIQNMHMVFLISFKKNLFLWQILEKNLGVSKNYKEFSQRKQFSLNNHKNSTNGWADIGYNFCVGDLGQIYEGRGYNRHGAHAIGFNARALGHCFFGSHSLFLPTSAALSSTQNFINCSRNNGFLTTGHWISTHRGDIQSNTVCPGNALNNYVAAWPRFISNP